jgi:hypothetical protein
VAENGPLIGGAAAKIRNFGLIAPPVLIFAIVAERMRLPLRAAMEL